MEPIEHESITVARINAAVDIVQVFSTLVTPPPICEKAIAFLEQEFATEKKTS